MSLFNPWVIIGILVAFISIASTSYIKGVDSGQLQQLAVQNELINRVNAKLSDNKKEASKLIKQRQDEIDELIAKRDALIFKLETERQANVKTTNDLRVKYAGLQLRFKATSSGGSGNGSTDQVPSETTTASDAETASCVVSDEVTTALREITYDCDTLRDDYELLYNYSHADDGAMLVLTTQ